MYLPRVNRPTHLLLALVALVTFAACVPMPIPRSKTTAYRTRGRVVDAISGDPVAGARIHYQGRNDLVFQSDAEGRFDIPEQRDLVLLTVVTIDPTHEYPKPHAMPRAVLVEKPGYARRKILLQPFYLQKWREQKPPYVGPRFIVELGDVEMEPTGDAG